MTPVLDPKLPPHVPSSGPAHLTGDDIQIWRLGLCLLMT